MTGPLVDFLPPDYRERLSRRRVWIFRISVTLLLTLVIAGATTAVQKKISRLDARLGAVRQKYEQARTRIAQVEYLDRQKDELARRLGVLKDILVKARGSLVIEAVGQSCPEPVRLTKVDLRVNSSGLQPQVDVTIEGRCPEHEDVADLLRSLAEKPLLDHVEMVLSEDVDATRSEKKFVITAMSPGLLTERMLGAAR